jgi:hypothetical protein
LATVTVCLALAFGGCRPAGKTYRSFSDFPGFEEYYAGRCLEEEPAAEGDDRALLLRYRPRLILPDGGRYPIDFYRDYLPYTVLRRYPEKSVVTKEVTPEVLKTNRDNKEVYLDFQAERYRAAGLDRRGGKEEEGIPLAARMPVVYGRISREQVSFPVEDGISRAFPLTFLKYNAVFAVSGLPAGLPKGYDLLLRMVGISPEEWHDLDNFVVVHVVLDEEKQPMAVILSQHNSHRTYLVDAQITLPLDGRMLFDVALRSNEVYPASDSPDPVRHRAIRGNRHLKYLLSGKAPPFLSADDVTQGREAGGKEIPYDLAFLSPCDPFYTARILLGEPRRLFGRYIGRDGPPGADYYAIPSLLPLGNLLMFGYLRDGDTEDIRVVAEAVDEEKRTIDVGRIMEHGGKRFFRDWIGLRPSGTPRAGAYPHGG